MDSTTPLTSASPPSRSVPRTKYGRSCTNCSKAKSKCTYLPGRTACERCDRLNKQCKPLLSVRRGEITAPSPSNNEESQINDKLDELISLLKARKGGSDVVSSPAVVDTPSAQDETSLPMHIRLDPTAMDDITDEVTAPMIFSATTSRSAVKHVPIPKLPVSPEQATRCFERFVHVMLPWLPFVHIPESMTLAQLESSYPTLHLCVMATVATSTSQLYEWSELFRQTVVRKMFEAGERSLDILLAIIAFIGWLRHHRQERPYFNLWLNMAITLVSDLGLDKRAQSDNTWWPWHRDSVGIDQSIVEKRAVLAVFVLSSISASSIKSVDSLQWTPHMDLCLKTLEEAPEYEGDRVLAVQVRCSLLTEVIDRATLPWPFSSGLMNGTDPLPFHCQADITSALENQLAELRWNVKNHQLEHNPIINLTILSTELDVQEAIANPEKPFEEMQLSPEEKLTRYNNQLTCLKTWWASFLAIPPDHWPDVSFPVLTQLIHAIVSTFRLRMLQYPGWDRQVVHGTANVMEYIANFANIVERAHEKVGLLCDRGDDVLLKTVKTMRKLRQYFLNILMLEQSATAGPDQPPIQFDETVPDMMDLDFWGSQWLTDMIVSWEK